MTASIARSYLGGISPESFARFVATRIRSVRWVGEEIRYDRVDLDRWLDEGAPHVASKSDAEWLAEFGK